MRLLLQNLLIGVVVFSSAQADELGDAVRQAVRSVEGSVVRIRIVGGEQSIEGESVTSQVTTGLVISAAGEILTSQFALEGQPQAVLAEDADGRDVSLKRVATDFVRRIVLLKASEGRWTPVSAPSEDPVRIGQWTIAVGRFFTPDQCNLSVGILSAMNRIHGLALQTDCKVSPVNYGGPLLDLDGRVLGILVPLSPRGQGGTTSGVEWYDSGIGFAIPLRDALQSAERLRGGKDLRPGRLGLSLTAADPYSPVLEVRQVLRGGPADKAGVQRGDRILTVAGRVVERAAVLEEIVARSYAGESLAMEIRRGEQTLPLQVELADELPVPVRGYLGLVPLPGAEGTQVGTTDPAAIARMLQERQGTPARPAPGDQPAAAPEKPGSIPVAVVEGSPAALAGLTGPVEITKVNTAEVSSPRALRKALEEAEPGTRIELEYQSDAGATPGSASLEAGAVPALVPVLSEGFLSAFRGSVAEGDSGETMQRREFPFEEQGRAVVLADRSVQESRPGLIILLSGHLTAEEELLRKWQSSLRTRNVVLVVPKNPENTALTADDIPLILASMQIAALEFKADLQRVVVAAERREVMLAWQLATGGPSPIRGIAVMSGWVPPGPIGTASGNGLSVLLQAEGDSVQSNALLKQNADALKKAGFQVMHPADTDMIRSIADWSILLRAL